MGVRSGEVFQSFKALFETPCIIHARIIYKVDSGSNFKLYGIYCTGTLKQICNSPVDVHT